MHNAVAPTSALKPHATDQPHPGPLAPVDQMLVAELLELDLEAAQTQSGRVDPLTNRFAQAKERAATKRTNRSTLNEIAASLGVSRSTLNSILEDPLRAEERYVEVAETAWDGGRNDHGVGRRRHTGAGGRRHTGAGVVRRGRVRTG